MCLLAIVHILLCAFGKADDHGFATLRTGTDFKKLQWFNVMVVQLPLNIVSGLIVFGSDYIRRCLLPPPKDEIWNPKGKLGYQSLAACWKANWRRKVLWVILSLTSLPIHVLYNSIILTSLPAYDAYEVLVDKGFFQGQSFDLSVLNVTEFKDQPGASVQYGTPWPGGWPGSSSLQRILDGVQQNSSSWTNLSNYDCRRNYGLELYSNFRTVIMVTNWAPNLSQNNSGLAVGTLPGFTPNGLPSRFMSLCPEAYLSVTPNTTIPPYPVYISVADMPACNSIFGADCTTWQWNGVSYGLASFLASYYAAYDLCYLYHTARNSPDTSQHVPLSYCLAEPLGETKAKLVWIKFITEIAAVALSIKAIAVLCAARCIQCDDNDGFPTGFPYSSLGRHAWLHILCYAAVNMGITLFCVAVAMGFSNSPPFGLGAAPAHDTDRKFILSILFFQNSLHAMMVVREYLEANYFEKAEGLSKGEPGCGIPLPGALFFWNLGLHQLVSAWLGTAMLDRYSLGSIEDANMDPTPTVILDSVLSGHTGVTIMPVKGTGWGGIFYVIVPIFAVLGQVFGINIVYQTFRRRTTSLPTPASSSSRRSSVSELEIDSVPLQELPAVYTLISRVNQQLL
ncbi:uncharacterized protein LY89DRAFT_718351 [Mollisia scopiformis]|uniref:DUF6536 domain-containing protein n=1 Tax=Mollisia scopiformis TaxID=149040 RepID=A0A194XC20_MOLSC|nr:uncharacterized protein LY89DRAFT_718351 [Mollisia scopiformis]KUJ17710.1 hypothetical protein LY89DRAFT_718351 [Mollisia scopiformis]